jgi:hypothetical protein
VYVTGMRTHVQSGIIKLPAMGDKRKVDTPLCPHGDLSCGSRKETANDHQSEEGLIRCRDRYDE